MCRPTFRSTTFRSPAFRPFALLFFAVAAFCPFAAAATDYLLVASRPNQLHVIDAAARRVVNTFTIPGDGLPSTLAIARDGKVAYVLTNRGESVSGIDLASGKEVFRADFSQGSQRVKDMFGMTVSDDGQYLYTHLLPVRIKADEYEVLDTQFAIYRTADGVGAKPIRSLPAPRRISMLLAGTDNSHFVAMGWDFYVVDAQSGAIRQTLPLRNWQRPGFGEPDMLAFWPQYEQSGIMSTPYAVPMSGADPASPEAFKTGILTFDLQKQRIATHEFENATRAFFSSVISPVNADHAFTVMNQLLHVDLAGQRVVRSAPLKQTYYAINIASDGREVYLGGALDTIAVHDTATLQQIGEIRIPGGADQGTTSLRIIRR